MFKVDITGKKYNRLSVLGFHEMRGRKSFWKCLCDCGNIIYTTKWHLDSNNTVSCGCFHRENAAKVLAKRNFKHGDTIGGRSRLHTAWHNMLTRCSDPNQPFYYRYGGRGIKVCKRWHTYTNFKIDMGQPPSKFHTIERLDNNKGYTPSNCVWLHRKYQTRNQSTNRLLTYKGLTQCLSAWAEEYNMRPHMLASRLKRGWDIEDALLIPSLRQISL